MQQRVSFDADDFVRQMRAAVDRDYATAMAMDLDQRTRAFIEAQRALVPAMENFARVHIGLREAGHDDMFIAQVAGVLAGGMLGDLLLNTKNRQAISVTFVSMMMRAAKGEGAITRNTFEVAGQPMGEA